MLTSDSPEKGSTNWLSDMKTNKDVETDASVLPETLIEEGLFANTSNSNIDIAQGDFNPFS